MEIPPTQESLIARVCDLADREAWDEFARIYRPVVYRLARSRGLQHADAQDLAQRVLISVARSIGDWERRKPEIKFRHWLLKVAKNATLSALSRQPKDRAGGGSSASRLLATQEAREGEDEIETEYRRQLFRRAAQRVRARADDTTWLAFSMTMVDGESIQTTAQRLGRSEGVIYAARSRIMKRLREVIQEMEQEFDG